MFDSVDLPIATTYPGSTPGYMAETGNNFPPASPSTSRRRRSPIVLPYSYSPDSADSVSAIVSHCAGTGQIKLP